MVEKEHRSAAKTVFVVMLVIELVIVLMIFMLTVVFSSVDSTPSFMGQSFYISQTEKMDDAVKVGSMVVAKNGRPGGSIVGGVILCENVDGFGTGIFRVVGFEATADTLIYKVCLDRAPETVFDINATNVVGECKYSYYTLGRFVSFVKSKPGVAICVVIPALLLALIELILGFSKELKRRELQKRRASVKKEQEKRYSSKSRREKQFSLDDFQNEDANLKRRHRKNADNDEIRPRRAVRSLSGASNDRARSGIKDDRTKVMEFRASDRSKEDAYDEDDMPYENKARVVENTQAARRRDPAADTYDAGARRELHSEPQQFHDDKEAYVPPIKELEPAYAAARQTAQADNATGAAEPDASEKAFAESEQPVIRTEPKKPALSLAEMMKLMQDNKVKLAKDIEDNKTDAQN